MPKKPVLVFVPGLWTGPQVFHPLVTLLQKYGYTTLCASLVSAGRSFDAHANPPGPTIHDDIASVRNTVAEAVDRHGGSDVVLVMHAGGGILGSMAINGLTKAARRQEGQKGGVTKLAYIAGLITYRGYDWPHFDFSECGTQMRISNPRILLFNDIEDDRLAEEYIASLQHQPGHGYMADITSSSNVYYAWQDDGIQSTYLVCSRDNVLIPPLQERSAMEAGCAFVEECEAGHMALLTQTEAVARFVRTTAGDVH